MKCIECGVKLTADNRGRWGPDHWCVECDKKRVRRISQQLEDLLMGFKDRKKE